MLFVTAEYGGAPVSLHFTFGVTSGSEKLADEIFPPCCVRVRRRTCCSFCIVICLKIQSHQNENSEFGTPKNCFCFKMFVILSLRILFVVRFLLLFWFYIGVFCSEVLTLR